MQVATLAAAACTCIAPWGRGAAGQGRRRRPRRSMCAAHGLDGVRGAPDLFINSSTHFCDSGESGDVICEVRGRRRGVKTNTESWRTRPARGGGTRNTESWRTRPARGGGTHTAARGLAKCAGAPLRSHRSTQVTSTAASKSSKSIFFFPQCGGRGGGAGVSRGGQVEACGWRSCGASRCTLRVWHLRSSRRLPPRRGAWLFRPAGTSSGAWMDAARTPCAANADKVPHARTHARRYRIHRPMALSSKQGAVCVRVCMRVRLRITVRCCQTSRCPSTPMTRAHARAAAGSPARRAAGAVGLPLRSCQGRVRARPVCARVHADRRRAMAGCRAQCRLRVMG